MRKKTYKNTLFGIIMTVGIIALVSFLFLPTVSVAKQDFALFDLVKNITKINVVLAAGVILAAIAAIASIVGARKKDWKISLISAVAGLVFLIVVLLQKDAITDSSLITAKSAMPVLGNAFWISLLGFIATLLFAIFAKIGETERRDVLYRAVTVIGALTLISFICIPLSDGMILATKLGSIFSEGFVYGIAVILLMLAAVASVVGGIVKNKATTYAASITGTILVLILMLAANIIEKIDVVPTLSIGFWATFVGFLANLYLIIHTENENAKYSNIVVTGFLTITALLLFPIISNLNVGFLQIAVNLPVADAIFKIGTVLFVILGVAIVVAAVDAIVGGFSKNKNIALVSSVLGAICMALILVWMESEQIQNLGFGYWIALLGFVVNAIAAGSAKKEGIQDSIGVRVFQITNTVVLSLLVVVTLYPIIHVVMASFSDGNALMGHRGLLMRPAGFSVEAYKKIFEEGRLIQCYGNTIFICVTSLIINMVLTSFAAYALTRKELVGRGILMKLILFTMYFGGGLIPTYMVIKDLGLLDSYLALILPTAMGTYNMIVLRTAFAAVPESLYEAARIDGAGHFRILFQIMMPLTKATLAVVVLYYLVGHWNSWFQASIYINDGNKWPLQLYLREKLIEGDMSMSTGEVQLDADKQAISETLKYAIIMVSTVPVLCVYPFLQKYFAKGVMIGAVKG